MVELGGPPAAWEALRSIGRTEDLRFSPSNRRLAIAAFAREAIAVADVAISRRAGRLTFDLHAVASLPLEGRQPHGLDWLDEDTLVVADRKGAVELVRVGAAPDGGLRLVGVPAEGSFEGTRSPGSVRVAHGADGCEVLVCNNYAGTVSRHLAGRSGGTVQVTGSQTLLQRWLDVPDGITVSPDGRWLAVSNHIPHLVMVYDRRRHLDETSDPDAVLRGAGYPHGLAFTADGAHLLVADAGSRYVQVFAAEGSWSGVHLPAASLAVMDEAAFARGRDRPQEGGPKGLDIDRSASVLVTTSEHEPLSVHALEALLDPGRHPVDAARLLAAELSALADDVDRRAGLEASARDAVASAAHRAEDAERRALEAEQRAAEAARRTEAALIVAREADARARAAAPPTLARRLIRRLRAGVGR